MTSCNVLRSHAFCNIEKAMLPLIIIRSRGPNETNHRKRNRIRDHLFTVTGYREVNI